MRATRKQKRRGEAGALREIDGQTRFAVEMYVTLPLPSCQAIEELTPERRLRFAHLAQDLGLFAYEQVIARLDEPDETFLPHFEMLARCVSVVEAHLEQVAL